MKKEVKGLKKQANKLRLINFKNISRRLPPPLQHLTPSPWPELWHMATPGEKESDNPTFYLALGNLTCSYYE